VFEGLKTLAQFKNKEYRSIVSEYVNHANPQISQIAQQTLTLLSNEETDLHARRLLKPRTMFEDELDLNLAQFPSKKMLKIKTTQGIIKIRLNRIAHVNQIKRLLRLIESKRFENHFINRIQKGILYFEGTLQGSKEPKESKESKRSWLDLGVAKRNWITSLLPNGFLLGIGQIGFNLTSSTQGYESLIIVPNTEVPPPYFIPLGWIIKGDTVINRLTFGDTLLTLTIH
jgi:hypothetical protein